MKAILYSRVSTKEQTEGVSIDSQLDRLRSYSKFKAWDIWDEVSDPGYSGKDDNRPD